jgi:hypothetical protein
MNELGVVQVKFDEQLFNTVEIKHKSTILANQIRLKHLQVLQINDGFMKHGINNRYEFNCICFDIYIVHLFLMMCFVVCMLIV